MARPDKAAAVAEIADSFRTSSAAVLTEYRGLSVAELTELRRAMGAGTKYAVVKNTLTKIAANQAGVEGLDDLLTGPTAVAFVDGDPVEAAKGLRDFARTHPLLIIKGGVLDGRPLSAAEIGRLADLESREVLLAKLAGALQASLSQAVGLFAAPLSQVARLAQALADKAAADPSVLRGGAGTPAVSDPAPAAAPGSEAAGEPAVDEQPAAPADTDAAPAAEVSTDTAAEAAAPADEAVAVSPEGSTEAGDADASDAPAAAE